MNRRKRQERLRGSTWEAFSNVNRSVQREREAAIFVFGETYFREN
jgi:hypothetical protein